MTKPADCHPDRTHLARGMCASCYQGWWKEMNPERAAERKKNIRPAPCHPDKPVLAQNLCGTCYRRKWRNENRERATEYAREYARMRLRTLPAAQEANRRRQVLKYGITWDQFVEFVDLQGGLCAACGEAPTRRLQVDHCHTTGRIRGLLCLNCNSALGYAKDDIHRLLGLIAYLTDRRPQEDSSVQPTAP